MAKITKEGNKEINEKNQSAYCGWYDRLCNGAIKHRKIQAESFPKR
jgi:hypothetical protein